MPEIKNSFLQGKMNKDLDERLIPNGQYKHAENIEISSSEGSGTGVVENILGNTQVGNFFLGSDFKCLGSVYDEKTNRLYWFVKNSSRDAIIEYDYFTREAHTVLCDLWRQTFTSQAAANSLYPVIDGPFLNFSGRQITGINIIDDFLYWTDGDNEPKRINLSRARKAQRSLGGGGKDVSHHSYVTDEKGDLIQFMGEEHVTVIRKRPTSAPKITINPKSTEKTQPIFEDIFPRFCTRYKYVDGEYSAFSPFTNVVFNPNVSGNYNSNNYFSSEESYNAAMVNDIESINIIDFVPSDIPEDVVQIDILYKQENSTVVYSVASVRIDDPEWSEFNAVEKGLKVFKQGLANAMINANDYIATGKLEIKTENLRGALPENQLLRIYDNVPTKALAQEITGNRLVYANYTQGYDLEDANNDKISVRITGEYESRINDEFDNQGFYDLADRSLKTQRDYQLGVTFLDKYGRETPVFTSSDAEVTIPWENANFENNLLASNSLSLKTSIQSTMPYWASYCKFYVKQTSGEYYNLVLHKTYLPGSYSDFLNENSHLYVSFSSSDIDKIKEEDYIIVKKIIKESGSYQTPNQNLFKVLDISEEAPDSIKYKFYKLADISNSNDVLADSAGGGLFPNTAQRIDFLNNSIGQDTILINSSVLLAQSGAPFLNEKDIYISWRAVTGSGTSYSERYKVTDVSDVSGNYLLKLSTSIKAEDATIAAGSSAALLNDDLIFKIEKKEENDAEEFSGFFFAKIKNYDLDVNDLLSTASSTTVDEIVLAQQNLYYWTNPDGSNSDITTGAIGAENSYSDPGDELTQVVANGDWAAENSASDWDDLLDTVNSNGLFFIDRMPFVAQSYSLNYYAKYSGDAFGREESYARGNHYYREKVWDPDSPMRSNQGQFDFASIPGGVNNYGWRVGAGTTPGAPILGSNFFVNVIDGLVTATSDHSEGKKRWISKSTGHITTYNDSHFDDVYEEGKTYLHISFIGPGVDLHDGNFNLSGKQINGPNSIADQLQGIWGGGFFTNGNSVPNQSSFYPNTLILPNSLDDEEFPTPFGQILSNSTNFDKSRKFHVEFESNHSSDNAPLSTPPQPGIGSGYDQNYAEAHYNQWNPAYGNPNSLQITNFLNNLRTPNAKFKFSGDTSEEVYTITKLKEKRLYNHTTWNLSSKYDYTATASSLAQIVLTNSVEYHAVQWADSVGTGYAPQSGASNLADAIVNFGKRSNRRVCFILELDKNPANTNFDPTDSNNSIDTNSFTSIEFIGDSSSVLTSDIVSHSAIVETKPKQITDLDIYYEASEAIPLILNKKNILNFAPLGCKVEFLDFSPANQDISNNFYLRRWRELSDGNLYFEIRQQNNDTTAPTIAGSNWFHPITGLKIDYSNVKVKFIKEDGSYNIGVISSTTDFPYYESDGVTLNSEGVDWSTAVDANYNPHGARHLFSINKNIDASNDFGLNWFNCYSFKDGVESNRVRDDFNAMSITNGAKASSTIETPYAEEERTNGLIYSGLYNSSSGVNNLNQFISAEKITKDLNISYGSIQKLFSRKTDLVAFCEDKVIKILANKDALFNAGGDPNLVATDKVLGQAVPFVGDYGISRNPESFASESYRAYFTDKQRGAVLRLSMDGLTPISDAGMRDWFRDNLQDFGVGFIGTYDNYKKEYNITFGPKYSENLLLNYNIDEGVALIEYFPGMEVLLNNQFGGGTSYENPNLASLQAYDNGISSDDMIHNRSLTFEVAVRNHAEIPQGSLQPGSAGATEAAAIYEEETSTYFGSLSGPVIYYSNFTNNNNGNPFGYNESDTNMTTQYNGGGQVGAIISRSVEDVILDETNDLADGLNTWHSYSTDPYWNGQIPNNDSVTSQAASSGNTFTNNRYANYSGADASWCLLGVEDNAEERPNIWWHTNSNPNTVLPLYTGQQGGIITSSYDYPIGSGNSWPNNASNNDNIYNFAADGTPVTGGSGEGVPGDYPNLLELTGTTPAAQASSNQGIIFSNLYFGQGTPIGLNAGGHGSYIEAPHNYYSNSGVAQSAPTSGTYGYLEPDVIAEFPSANHASIFHGEEVVVRISSKYFRSKNPIADHKYRWWIEIHGDGVLVDSSYLDDTNTSGWMASGFAVSTEHNPDVYQPNGSYEFGIMPTNSSYTQHVKFRFKDPNLTSAQESSGVATKIFDKLTVRVGVTAYGHDGDDGVQTVQYSALRSLQVVKVRWLKNPYIAYEPSVQAVPSSTIPEWAEVSAPLSTFNANNFFTSNSALITIGNTIVNDYGSANPGSLVTEDNITYYSGSNNGVTTYNQYAGGAAQTLSGTTNTQTYTEFTTNVNDTVLMAASGQSGYLKQTFDGFQYEPDNWYMIDVVLKDTYVTGTNGTILAPGVLGNSSDLASGNGYGHTHNTVGSSYYPKYSFGQIGGASLDGTWGSMIFMQVPAGTGGDFYAGTSSSWMQGFIDDGKVLRVIFQYKAAEQTVLDSQGNVIGQVGATYHPDQFRIQCWSTNLEITTVMLHDITETPTMQEPSNWYAPDSHWDFFPHACVDFIENATIYNALPLLYTTNNGVAWRYDGVVSSGNTKIGWEQGSNEGLSMPAQSSYDGYDFKFTIDQNPQTQNLTGGLNIRIGSEYDTANNKFYGAGITLEGSDLVAGDYHFRINFDESYTPQVISAPPGSTPFIDRVENLAGVWQSPPDITSQAQANKVIFYCDEFNATEALVTQVSLLDATNMFTGGSIGDWVIDMGYINGVAVDPTLENFIVWNSLGTIQFNQSPGYVDVDNTNQRIYQALDTEYILPGQTYEISFDYNFTQGSLQYYFYLNNTTLEGFSSDNISGSGSYSALHTIGEDSGQGFNMMDSFVFTVDNGPLTGTIDNIVMRLVPSVGFYPKTISYNEDVKGWTSFKSFIPESGGSLANKYYTFFNGNIYEHYKEVDELGEAVNRNNFYGDDYDSIVNVVLNEGASSVKNFKSISYEGSQSNQLKYDTLEYVSTDGSGLTESITDQDYYNSITKQGWEVTKITTDLQEGKISEFIKKEGKWFNYIRGLELSSITSSEVAGNFNVQGLGFVLTVEHDINNI